MKGHITPIKSTWFSSCEAAKSIGRVVSLVAHMFGAFGDPQNKDYNILGSVLGSSDLLNYGNCHFGSRTLVP